MENRMNQQDPTQSVALAYVDMLVESAGLLTEKEVHHFKIKTDHATSPIKKGLMRFTSNRDMEHARAATIKHYEGQGHTNVQATHIKSVPAKVSKSTPEQRMKGRERHWLRTGVSPQHVERMRRDGWL
jgi:hypothetical protein